VLHAIVDVLARLMAPILSFTAEDVWANVPGTDRPESVFLAGLSEPPAAWRDDMLAARFERLLALRGAVSKAIEEERQAGRLKQSTEARVTLSRDGLDELAAGDTAGLATLFLTADVVLADGGPRVERAPGEKCPRCWNIRALGEDARHPDLCARCAGVVA
jgi:isoleucyl-tRNA synthetase